MEAQIAQSLEQVIQAGAIDNECKFDSKTNTMLRVVNSKEIVVRDKNSFKKAYKEMKEKYEIPDGLIEIEITETTLLSGNQISYI